jgi:hypothetical protein
MGSCYFMQEAEQSQLRETFTVCRMEAVDLRACMGKTLIRLRLIYRALLLGWRRKKSIYIKPRAAVFT